MTYSETIESIASITTARLDIRKWSKFTFEDLVSILFENYRSEDLKELLFVLGRTVSGTKRERAEHVAVLFSPAFVGRPGSGSSCRGSRYRKDLLRVSDRLSAERVALRKLVLEIIESVEEFGWDETLTAYAEEPDALKVARREMIVKRNTARFYAGNPWNHGS